jgi:nitrite reductase/ring-hydroxylating ferredoxin subunit/DMSO/TMAO reductase YedYZ heme-binding membrane subunit
MSNAYQAVQWNRHKRVYDMAVVAGVILYIVGFIIITKATHRSPNDLSPPPVLLMRATATCAFIMLHLILVIGPLARLSPRFAPLLYNRRHMGVMTFAVASAHAIIATIFYHGLGNANPILGIFTDNTRYDSLTQFPFQTLGFAALLILFIMASTSHDYWLKNLGASTWKALHMLVYVAYTLLVMHVALGALQSEMHPAYVALTAGGVVLVAGLHLIAGFRESRVEAAGQEPHEWMRVGSVDDIKPDRALVVPIKGAERVSVFRHDNKISAISNVCAHQGGPLVEGKIVGGCLTCPWHGYQYRVESGQSPPPFSEKVPTYRVKLEGRDILLDPRALPPGTPVEPALIENTQETKDG